MGQPQRPIVDVHLLLVRDGQILLTQRHGGYAAGGWHAPSGKVDTEESILDAVIREGFEEVGIHVKPTDLRCVHTLHVHNPGEQPRIGWFFETTRWTGEPVNHEPDKCAAIGWFALDGGLPDTMIPTRRRASWPTAKASRSASSAGANPPPDRSAPQPIQQTPAPTT
jgi:8-oxo-dGTP diphosphatase